MDVANKRILLLTPSSVSAEEQTIRHLFATLNQSNTDLQMLDRINDGLVTLPRETYDVVVVLKNTHHGSCGLAAHLEVGDKANQVKADQDPNTIKL